MKKSLKFIGRNSGFVKTNTSAYYEENNEFILIDCGFTVFKRLKESIDFSKYEKINIIITHLHNDHSGSLSQFILYLWFEYGKKTRVISKCKNIGTFLEITGTIKEAYEITDTYSDLVFIETKHVDILDCYGFKVTINGEKIVYTGDTRIIEPFLEYLEDADEFYIDVSKVGLVHIKFDEVIEQLNSIKANGTKVFLMHIDDYEYIKKLNNEQFFFA